MSPSKQMLVIFYALCLIVVVSSADTIESKTNVQKRDEFVGRMIEEGRTLVHHAMKRFMIILPAIFFKLGIAFTMLIIVTIAAVNNGFIGFLLLVVGLSSVLARLQDAAKPLPTVPYYAAAAIPAYNRRHTHDWDRSDRASSRDTSAGVIESSPTTSASPAPQPYSAYSTQYLYTPLSTYNPSFYGPANV